MKGLVFYLVLTTLWGLATANERVFVKTDKTSVNCDRDKTITVREGTEVIVHSDDYPKLSPSFMSCKIRINLEPPELMAFTQCTVLEMGLGSKVILKGPNTYNRLKCKLDPCNFTEEFRKKSMVFNVTDIEYAYLDIDPSLMALTVLCSVKVAAACPAPEAEQGSVECFYKNNTQQKTIHELLSNDEYCTLTCDEGTLAQGPTKITCSDKGFSSPPNLFTCSICPPKYSVVGSECFMMGDTPVTWAEARSRCEKSVGDKYGGYGDLAAPLSWTNLTNWLNKEYPRSSKQTWAGGQRRDKGNTFEWVTGDNMGLTIDDSVIQKTAGATRTSKLYIKWVRKGERVAAFAESSHANYYTCKYYPKPRPTTPTIYSL